MYKQRTQLGHPGYVTPVINIKWDIKLGKFLEEGRVSHSIKGLAEIQGNNNYVGVSGKEQVVSLQIPRITGTWNTCGGLRLRGVLKFSSTK